MDSTLHWRERLMHMCDTLWSLCFSSIMFMFSSFINAAMLAANDR